MFETARGSLCLRPTPPGKTPDQPGGLPEGDPGPEVLEDGPVIRCRQCLQEITRSSEKIAVDGAHRHTFANPLGLVFEIGCFASVKHLFFCSFKKYCTNYFAYLYKFLFSACFLIIYML